MAGSGEAGGAGTADEATCSPTPRNNSTSDTSSETRLRCAIDLHDTMFSMSLRSIPISPSTNIQAVDYDDETSEMYITFVRGPQYLYRQVGQTVADGFQTSGIPAGSYFRANILNQYDYERVS